MIEKNESVVAGLKKMREGLLPGDCNDLLSEAIYSIQSLSKANDTFVGLHHKNRELTAEVEKLSKGNQHLFDANGLLNDKCERLMKEIAVLEAAQKDRPNMDHLFNKTKGLVEEVKALKQEVEAAKARYADATSLLFQSRETVGRQLDIIENLAQVLDKVSAY